MNKCKNKTAVGHDYISRNERLQNENRFSEPDTPIYRAHVYGCGDRVVFARALPLLDGLVMDCECKKLAKSATMDSISLKWGTLRTCVLHSKNGRELMKKYKDLGYSVSVLQQKDTPEQKELICQMIDACNTKTILIEWSGVQVSKEEAKKYVMNYGAKRW